MTGISIKQLVLLLLLLAATAGVTRWLTPPEIIFSTQAQQKELDSLTVELQNTVADKRTILDSLDRVSDAFRDRLKQKDERIASLSRITGTLRLERDSLSDVVSAGLIDLVVPVRKDTAGRLREGVAFRDTTLVARSVFGDSLIAATARGGIRSDSLFVEPPDIAVLRPVRLDVAVLVSDDRTAVHTIVTSRDLQDLRVESMTEIRPPRRKFPAFWVGMAIGFGGAVVLN